MPNALDSFYQSYQLGKDIGGNISDARTARKQQEYANRLAPELQAGNYAGAADVAFEQGDLGTGLKMQEQVRALAQADREEARDKGEQFMKGYGQFSDVLARVDSLYTRGVIDDDQRMQALEQGLTALRPLLEDNEDLAEAVPNLLQAYMSAPPGSAAVYNEEFTKQELGATDPTQLRKEGREERKLGFDERRVGLAESEAERRAALDERRLALAERGTAPGSGSGGKLTEGQRKFATFARLAENSQKTLETLEGTKGFDPTLVLPSGANVARQKEGQRYDAAKKTFIDAIIRPMTGAAVTEFEFNSANRRYFPQFGDDKKTVEFKSQQRQEAIDAIKAGSAGAFEAINPQTESDGTAPRSTEDLLKQYGGQ